MKTIHPIHLAVALGAALTAAAAPSFPVSGENGALRLTIDSLRTAPQYGEAAAPVGRQWLVLAVRWENRIDPKLAAARELATEYENGELARHLYVVIDGRALGTLAAGLDGGGGRTSLGAIAFAKPGAKVEGDLVFDLPADPFASVDLRYYDDTTGHFAVALAGQAPSSKPLTKVIRNEVGEFALYAIDNPVNGVTAPPGARAVSLELRGRSILTSPGAAPGYDASRPPGAQIQQVKLLDWPETHKSFLLLADGEYAFAPQGGTLPDQARFLPDCSTGGTLVFFVPATSKSLELTCTMTRTNTGEDAPDAATFNLSVSGTPPKLTPAKLPLQIKDEMFQVGIAARRTPEFANQKAPDGQTFVVLDVIAENTGTGPEYFQPRDQVSLVYADGGAQELDELTARGARRPEEVVFVPAGTRRRFELVFPATNATAPAKLRFRGGSFQQDYDLPLNP